MMAIFPPIILRLIVKKYSKISLTLCKVFCFYFVACKNVSFQQLSIQFFTLPNKYVNYKKLQTDRITECIICNH